jgi:di/tricarboxylate transporter
LIVRLDGTRLLCRSLDVAKRDSSWVSTVDRAVEKPPAGLQESRVDPLVAPALQGRLVEGVFRDGTASPRREATKMRNVANPGVGFVHVPPLHVSFGRLPPLGFHAAVVLLLVVVALWFYSRPHLPIETTSLGILTVLPFFFAAFPFRLHGQRLDPTIFFTGFSDSALVAIVALMVAGSAVVRTGALAPIVHILRRVWSHTPRLALLLVLVITGFLSAFVNDTPLVILLIPMLIDIATSTGGSPSRVLMPLGFAALIGGMATTIGTATNLIVVSFARRLGLPPMGMFFFTLPAVCAGVVGLLYLWLVAPHLLPDRRPLVNDISVRRFRALLEIPADSPTVGETLAAAQKSAEGMRVRHLLREGKLPIVPLPDLVLQAGDRLEIEDTPTRLKEYETLLKGQLFAGEKPWAERDPSALDDDQQLAEIVAMPGSRLSGRSLKDIGFSARYDLVPLGIYRRGSAIHAHDLEEERLQRGDVILVQGARERIAQLRSEGRLTLLDATTDLPRSTKANLTLLIMAAIVLPAALGVLPIAVTAPFGVLLMAATGCIRWREAGGSVNVGVVLLIAAGVALSLALVDTGGARFLAALILLGVHSLPPAALVGLILVAVAVLGNVASHTTAALVGLPIAVAMAHGLGLTPTPFLLAVLFGANLGYATPLAYQTNVLVMNAAGYEFRDFVRVGLPLLVVMAVLLSFLIPAFFPFH